MGSNKVVDEKLMEQIVAAKYGEGDSQALFKVWLKEALVLAWQIKSVNLVVFDTRTAPLVESRYDRDLKILLNGF